MIHKIDEIHQSIPKATNFFKFKMIFLFHLLLKFKMTTCSFTDKLKALLGRVTGLSTNQRSEEMEEPTPGQLALKKETLSLTHPNLNTFYSRFFFKTY